MDNIFLFDLAWQVQIKNYKVYKNLYDFYFSTITVEYVYLKTQ